MRRVLVPVDYSDPSVGVVRYAAEVAARLGGELTVLHVWECMPHAPPDLMVKGRDGKVRRLDAVIRDNAETEMKQFLVSAGLPSELPLKTKVQSGDAAEKILALLATGKYDLCVMGTHGRGGVKHLVLGSVAEKIVRASPVPVLTVPVRPDESE